jgi:uncharacterized protein YecE (DUF72 family)
MCFIKSLNDLLSSINLGKLRLALEVRKAQPCRFPRELLKIMQKHNLVHCVDLSRGEEPAYEPDMLYSRLFGRGAHNIYQPTDEELAEIDRKALAAKAQTIMLSFHFVRMYKDDARLKIYKETGSFPQVTKHVGLASLEDVLQEDA